MKRKALPEQLSRRACYNFYCDRLRFQEVRHVGDNAHVLNAGRVLVAVFDGELALLRVLNLAESAARVFGKLLGRGAGVLGGLFNHGRLDLVEFRKLVLHLLVVVVGRNGNTLAKPTNPVECVQSLTQKHVAKRYMIGEKFLPLRHES